MQQQGRRETVDLSTLSKVRIRLGTVEAQDGHEKAMGGCGMNYENIPPLVMAAMKRYVDRHTKSGGFLTAVICNNLTDAVFRADKETYRALRDIVGWFWNVAPSDCWGSKEKMETWLALRDDVDVIT